MTCIVCFSCPCEAAKFRRSLGVPMSVLGNAGPNDLRVGVHTRGIGIGNQFRARVGRVVHYADIRAQDVANEDTASSINPSGWTMGMSVIGIWREQQEAIMTHHPLDFVFDEHDLDMQVFPDQFGRPRDEDGNVKPFVHSNQYNWCCDECGVWIDDPTKPDHYGCTCESPDLRYEIQYYTHRAPEWRSTKSIPDVCWTPRDTHHRFGRGIDNNDMYAMSNQHKALDESSDDE